MDVQAQKQLIDRESTGILEIVIKGAKIDAEKDSVDIIFLKLYNPSFKSVPVTSFLAEWGVEFEDSATLQIFEVNAVDASRPEIVNELNIANFSTNKITFNPLNFNSSDWIQLRITVLRKKHPAPLKGRIFGNILDTKTSFSIDDIKEKSISKMAFEGPISVQLIRVLSYSPWVPLLLLFLLFVFGNRSTDQKMRNESLKKMTSAGMKQYPKYREVFKTLHEARMPARHYTDGSNVLHELINLKDKPVPPDHWALKKFLGQVGSELFFHEKDGAYFINYDFLNIASALMSQLYPPPPDPQNPNYRR